MIYSIYETFCCFDEKGVILNIFFVQVSQGYGRGLRELVKVFLNLITDQSHSCCQCYNLQEAMEILQIINGAMASNQMFIGVPFQTQLKQWEEAM